jgi:primosomal protein N' (replication factor Y) (superfamily II helicase)
MDRLFHYRIPENISNEIAVGQRAFVPFQTRRVVGYVVGLGDEAEVKEVKDIEGIIDKEPILTEEMLKLTKWIKETYFCSWGEAIEAAIPAGIKHRRFSCVGPAQTNGRTVKSVKERNRCNR